MQDTVRQKTEQILDEQVRPYLRQHRGNIRLIEIKDRIASVKLLGQCLACANADETFHNLVETALIAVDGIDKVELVQDLDPELIDLALQILRKNNKPDPN